MRYYVLCFSDYEGIPPYVVAEVVREVMDDDRDTTLAAALAGDRAMIVTRAELVADTVGRRALESWENRDDNSFYRESDAILTDTAGVSSSDTPPRLRLVDPNEPAKPRATRIPGLLGHRDLLYKTQGLRLMTRALVERAREERAVSEAARARASGFRIQAVDNDG
jgi:hypothetical protein